MALFADSFRDSSSIFSNVLQRSSGTENTVIDRWAYLVNPLRRSVSIDRCRRYVPFEPVQLGYEILDLLLDVFGMLQVSVSVTPDSRSLDKYLVMFDERAHPT